MISRDDGKITSDAEKVANTFSKFFVNIGNISKIEKEFQNDFDSDI